MEPQLALALLLVAIVVVVSVLKLRAGGSGAGGKGSKGSGSSKTVVDVEAEADSKPVIRILYGTQTGTAERFSKSLGAELRRKYGESTTVDVLDIENYKNAEVRLPKERLVLFLMATYGDGEPTDNAADFYSWICTEAEAVENGEKEPFLQVSSSGDGGDDGGAAWVLHFAAAVCLLARTLCSPPHLLIGGSRSLGMLSAEQGGAEHVQRCW